MMAASDPSSTRRYPHRSVNHPLAKAPTMVPTLVAFVRPTCQGPGIWWADRCG